MSGVSFNNIANFFTRASDYEVDFSNTINVITSRGVTSYSQQEVFDRAYIWGVIIVGGVGGFLLNQLRSNDSGGLMTALSVSVGVIAGFAYTHHQVIAPKISFRTKMNDKIKLIKFEILEQAALLFQPYDLDCAKNLGACVGVAENVESFDGSKSLKAMATLSLRYNALRSILNKLSESNLDYWQQDSKDILKDLNINKNIPEEDFLLTY